MIRKNLIYLCMIMLLVTVLLTNKRMVYAESEGAVLEVSTEEGFLDAIKNASPKDTIKIMESITVNDTNSDSAPLIIDKEVTIKGETLYIRTGGIVLGADVVFEDIQLCFPNRVRNAMIANGYSLTLNNVTRDDSARQIHLICGGLTGYEGTADIPPSGPHGKIIIKGKTALGNIYAGSLSGDGQDNIFEYPASIIIEDSAAGKMGKIYGCGALQTPVNEDELLNPNYEPEAPTASAEKFKVTGDVNIQIYNTTVSYVDGSTGGNKDASLTYIGGEYTNSTLTLNRVSSIKMVRGNLIPASGSSLSENADITVPENTLLSFVSFDETVSINDFSGGGTIVLGQNQTLNIEGTVNGSAAVGIDYVFNDASSGIPLYDHTYISAFHSSQDSFVLIPHNAYPEMLLFYNLENGKWMITKDDTIRNPFTDVKKSDYFYEPVLWAADMGITSGYTETLFKPEEICTRAQAVTFLWRVYGSPSVKTENCDFIDIDEGDYYYEAVLWAVKNEITAGVSDTLFAPEDECTRSQIVSFLWRADYKPEPMIQTCSFTDVIQADYYYDAVLWAVENEITSGLTNTAFGPDHACTRGQIVTFLYRY